MNPLSTNCSIRAARAADIPAILKLATNTPRAAHWPAEKYHDIFDPASPRRLALVVEDVNSEDANSIHGFLVALCTGPEWELENLAVEPPRQRHGFGSRLLKEFLEIARKRNAASVLLEVRESNLAARHLYEKAGFLQAALRPNYYQQPSENAVIYKFSIG